MQNAALSTEIAASGGARSVAPVFVLGCPRSGTTLLYHMLLSAGNFAVYRAESQVFNLLEPRFGDLSVAANRRRLLAAWQETELFRRTGLDANHVREEVMARCRNGGDFLKIVMDAMARSQGMQRWADCTPEHLLYLDRIKETIPDALVIHIIRDGRDVALSLEKQGWIRPFPWNRKQTLAAAALYWEWIVQKGRRGGRALGADYIEVRYEDLVREPRAVLATVGKFIGQELDYDGIERTGIGSVSKPNSSFAVEEEFTPVGRWKHSLSEAQSQQLEELLGKTLRELGYSEDGSADQSTPRAAIARMRSLYRSYFDVKLSLKKTWLGKLLISPEMPRH